MFKLSRRSLVASAVALLVPATAAIDPAPVFAVLEQYKAACDVFIASKAKSDLIDVTYAPLRELVFLTTEEGEAAQREYFTVQIRLWENGVERGESIYVLPHVRHALTQYPRS